MKEQVECRVGHVRLPKLAWMFPHCGFGSTGKQAAVFHYPRLSQFSLNPGLEWSSMAWDARARQSTRLMPNLRWTVLLSLRIHPGQTQRVPAAHCCIA